MNGQHILSFILHHVEEGTLELVFNETTLDKAKNLYILEPFGIKISFEMLEDIKSKPDHYQKFLLP